MSRRQDEIRRVKAELAARLEELRAAADQLAEALAAAPDEETPETGQKPEGANPA